MADVAVPDLMPRHRFEAIGTSWRVVSAVSGDPAVQRRIADHCGHVDATWSRFRADSPVQRLAKASGTHRFPESSRPLIDLYRSLYYATGGAVTPLIGAALEHLGYDADYALRRRPGSAETPSWDDVLAVDGTTVTTDRPVVLDVGAAGKGFLIDGLATILQQSGADEYLIDGSGDLLHRGSESCRVGLEHPLDPTLAIGVADLRNAALGASAVNRRQWGAGLHHIVDPATGEPATGTLASWVVADTAMLADGLATALFFTPASVLARHFRFSYVRMAADGSVDWSTDFPGELFL